MIGREQWLTCIRDGTLFASSHLLPQDVHSADAFVTSWLHRSTDGGRTWERARATIDADLRCGVPEKNGTHASRNVVEMPDGSLLFGVAIGMADVAYMWKSTDRGVSWDKTRRVNIRGYYDNVNAFFTEDFTYRTDSGELLHWCRVGPPSPMYPKGDAGPAPSGDDSVDRMMITRSGDEGMTWEPLSDFGDYGAHYPRPLKLRDGRLLLTYTQRSTFYPLGLRAVISHDDAQSWDWEHDAIVIEGSTPWGGPSGGGFGNTVQLDDGTLLSCYSHRTPTEPRRIEVAHWELP